MRLHEYEALDIFEQNRIPVPRRELVSTMHEALHVAGEIGYPGHHQGAGPCRRARPRRRHQNGGKPR